jgi:Cu(I)/Ag(I) efflux system membrane fusion protein
VKKGDLFYTLYSPELLALQNDYIAAAKAGYKDLAASARKRMKLLGVDDKALETIAKTGKAYDSVPFYIPADGILNRLEIRKGTYIKANDAIAVVQDLSTVWVEAAIPEKDLNTIKEGDKAKVTASGSSSELEATVDYIYPIITQETRTGKARLVVDNPDYLLKPSGYATVIFAGGASERVSVPSSAVLRDTSGSHVILAMGNGKFQARLVQTGFTAEGRTEITEGLSEGEEVVVNGQFLIDSESNLRESLNKISGGSNAQ